MICRFFRIPGRFNVAVLTALVALSAVAGFGAGCAYYNILYNAKGRYKDAVKMPRDKEGAVTAQQIKAYDAVIEKCNLMITTYPDSRWVDDAMLLIARARYGQDDFEAAVDKIIELEEGFPETDLMEKAIFLKGQSYADWGKDQEAIEVLVSFMEKYPKSDVLDHVLYYAGRSSMRLGDETGAIKYLDRLGKEFPKSRYKLDADIEFAKILLETGQFEKSLEIYQRLSERKLKADDQYRVLNQMALAYKELGRYHEVLDLLTQTDLLVLDSKNPADKVEALLLAAESYVGLDSLDRAIDVYIEAANDFKKSKYSAEANYRIGVIYQERFDSLAVAVTYFNKVPQQYSRSEFAGDAIKRSSNISTLIKLRESSGDESPEARALRQFSLAETQLLQFNDTKKALEGYQIIIDEFPLSEFGPKAAYAIGYIYGVVLRDSVKAHESYVFLVDNYPDSKQAMNASNFYAPAADSSVVQPRQTDQDGEVDETNEEG